jgi:hypothetical protein
MNLEMLLVVAASADPTDGGIGFTDVGTGAAIGGVLGEGVVRLASMFGRELDIDGWREGMFMGALLALSYSALGALGA